jgi:hypothetical protein
MAQEIGDELLRFIKESEVEKQIKSDFAELHKCMGHESWKASIVLIGSLIESVLYNYINNTDSVKSNIPQFSQRNATLNDFLQWARQHNIIDENLFRLSEPIRDYRNTIHPKVQQRLGTEISRHLVEIGYNILLEIIRSINKHFVALESQKIENKVKQLVEYICNRSPHKAEYVIYIPILEKYGITRGSKIIERSLHRGST